MDVKKCSKCKLFFSKSDFPKDITRNDGYRSSCKRCTNQYYYDNQNRILDNHKFYIKNNRSKINAYERDKRKFDSNFNLHSSIRQKTNRAFKSPINKMNKLIGCSNYHLRKWILHQLYGDMTEENYGVIWCLDHCIALKKTKENDLYKYTNWNNLRPLYIKDNVSKGSKIDYHLYLLQQVKAKSEIKINKDLIKIFVDEIYSRPPMRIYPTNKTVYNNIDEIWSIVLADMIDYKILNNRGYRYIFIIIDTYSKYLWAIPLKNKYSQTITNEFLNILTTSKGKPLKIESDRGAEFYNSIFQNFLKLKNIHHYSRFTDKGPSIAERVIRTIRNLLKKPIFEKGRADWLSELPSVIKKYNNTIHSSTKKTPIQASKKSNEKEVYSNLQDKRRKLNPEYNLGQLVRTADIKKVF